MKKITMNQYFRCLYARRCGERVPRKLKKRLKSIREIAVKSVGCDLIIPRDYKPAKTIVEYMERKKSEEYFSSVMDSFLNCVSKNFGIPVDVLVAKYK